MKIKKRDVIFSSATVLQGSVFTVNMLMRRASYEAWWIYAVVLVISLLPIFIYGRTNIYEETGFVIHWLYVIFFIAIAAYNIKLLGTFVGEYVLSETPRWIFTVLFTALCIYGAAGGVKKLSELALVFFVIAVFSWITNLFLLAGSMETENLLPVLRSNALNYAETALSGGVFLLCDGAVLMCFKKEKGTLSGFALGGVLLFAVCAGTAATLGATSGIYTWPTYEALRVIKSGNVMTRFETSSVFSLIALMFFKVSIMLCGASEGIRKIKSVPFRVIITGCVAGVAAAFITVPASVLVDFLADKGVYILLPFVVFPLFIRVFGGFKKYFPKKQKKC